MILRTAGIALSYVLIAAPLAALVTAPLAGSPAAEADALHRRAVAWLKANTVAPGPPPVYVALSPMIRADVDRNASFSILLGAGLVRSGRPHIVQSCAGALFVFPLSARQAQALKISPRDMRYQEGSVRRDHRAPKPPVSLEGPVFRNAAALDAARRITGTVRYHATRELASPRLVLRLSYMAASGGTSAFHYLQRVAAGKGTLRFSFNPVNPPGDNRPAHVGPLPLFLDVAILSGRDLDLKCTLFSNTRGRLGEVLPPGQRAFHRDPRGLSDEDRIGRHRLQ